MRPIELYMEDSYLSVRTQLSVLQVTHFLVYSCNMPEWLGCRMIESQSSDWVDH